MKVGVNWMSLGERLALTAVLLTATVVSQPVAMAQSSGGQDPASAGTPAGVSSSGGVAAAAAVDAYWTPQRLLDAKPLELVPQVGPNGLPIAPQGTTDTAPPVQSGGGLPTLTPAPHDAKTFIPAAYLDHSPLAGVIPNATSSYGARYTTSRVFPDAAVNTYPTLTAGKLFFSDPRTGGNFVCSASVLRIRVVVTAGHCVTHPSTVAAQRYFYSNFLFVPAYINGAGVVGSFTPFIAWVTNTWFFSNGSVPNAQDVGMLVMNDKSGFRIGNYTGYLGYFTLQLGNNEVTMLGYPCNLDSCQREQVTNAHTFAYGGNNTYTYGSAARGGASGGPWIQDFGVAPVSSPFVSLGNNYLVAVTSYGPVSTTPKYLGASNLDSRFINLLNAACGGPGTPNNC